MKREDLEKAFSPIPEDCYNAMMTTAQNVKEEETVKRKASFALVLAAVLVLAVTAALAVAYWQRGPETVILEHDDYIDSLVVHNGKLYSLQQNGLHEISPENREADISYNLAWDQKDYENSIHELLSDQGVFYGLYTSTEEPWRLYTLELVNGEVQRTLQNQFEMPQDLWYTKAYIQNGKLVSQLKNDIIAIYDIAANQLTKLTVKDVYSIAAYKDGLALAIQYKREVFESKAVLSSIDLKTGETSTLTSMQSDYFLSNLAYNQETDTIYFADRSRIFSFKEGKAVTQVASFVQGDTSDLVLIDDDYAAITIDGSILSIRAINPDKAGDLKQLTIFERYGRGGEYEDFIKFNPDVDLVFYKDESGSVDELFVQHMITKNADVDIYCLTDPNLMQIIKDKGYYIDLAASETIKTKTADMYAPFQTAFTNEDEIVAIPKEVFLPMSTYNAAAFKDLGIAVPTTYEAFYDFCILWLTELGPKHPEYRLNPYDNDTYYETLLKRYADEMAHNGKEADFSSPTLQTVIEKFRAVEALPQLSYEQATEYLFYNYYFPTKTPEMTHMPLTFEKDNLFTLGMVPDNLAYFVINPYSKNQTEAIAFLDTYMASIENYVAMVLFKAENKVMENEAFQTNLKQMNEHIAQLEAQHEKAEPAEQKDLQIQIDNEKQAVENYEAEYRYAVKREDMDAYISYVPGLYWNPMNPILALGEAVPQTLPEVAAVVRKMLAEGK